MASLKQSYFIYRSPVGPITIASNGQALTNLIFGEYHFPGDMRATDITNRASNQLQEYFAGKRQGFDLPLAPTGTDFQQQVWTALQKIPYGETRSYRDIANMIGSPRAYRAVGSANNRNPLQVVVPCHRVIGSNGKPIGYAAGLHTKEFLLNLESTHKDL